MLLLITVNDKLCGKKITVIHVFLLLVIGDTTFFLAMANYFCITNEGVYVPAELSIVKFNLQQGRLKQFHVYLNPGTLLLIMSCDSHVITIFSI